MDSSRVVLLLLLLIFFQTLASLIHIRYSQKEIRELAKKHDEGFLGVGVTGKRFKPGKMALVVTDKYGTIIECNIHGGLTIFSKFRPYEEYIGENILEVNWDKKHHKKVVEEAIKKVREQMASPSEMSYPSLHS